MRSRSQFAEYPRLVIVLFLVCFQDGFGQTQPTSVIVNTVMTGALSRCYTNIQGVKRISFEPATNADFSQITSLGNQAISPLASYLDAKEKDGFTQLFAVKFIIALGGESAVNPLKRATEKDQWEVTRAQALAGLFQISPSDAKPYIEALLHDDSPLLKQRANDLWKLYASSP